MKKILFIISRIRLIMVYDYYDVLIVPFQVL